MKKMFLAIIALLLFVGSGGSVSAQTVKPLKKPPPKSVVKKPAPKMNLHGSKKVARRQNTQANKERLTRLQDEAQLRRFIEAGLLVSLPDNLLVRVDPRLGKQYRYCRPWTRDFLNDLGRAHVLAFNGRPIRVNSAVRPISRQKVLQGTNGNAAPIDGPLRSSHLTGSTIDIAKGDDLEWMRNYLRSKKAAGQIEVVEEFAQPVFHVMVFQNYGKKTVSVKSKAPPKKPAPKKRR